MSPVSFVDTRWSVINPPPEPISISKDGKILKMKTRPESDWWHTPTIDSSSGTVYGLKTDLTKQGLTASVELSIDYVDQVSDRYILSQTLSTTADGFVVVRPAQDEPSPRCLEAHHWVSSVIKPPSFSSSARIYGSK